MGRHEEIRNSIRRLAEAVGPVPTMLARVKSVDKENAVVVLEESLPDGSAIDVFDVRLRPVINGKQAVLMIPKTGSFVLCARIENTEDWMVVGVDEVDSMLFQVGESMLVIDQQFELKNASVNIKEILNGLCDALLSIYAPKDITKITETKLKIQTLFK